MSNKRVIRARMRTVRDDFVRAKHPPIGVPAAFSERLFSKPIVASYVPLTGEANPSPLERAASDASCGLALPFVVDRATPLRFLAWRFGATLRPGPFGLRQPADDSEELVPDIILTPLVAFDAALNRIGQGAGHYDRAFATHPDAWRVGVAWSVQQVDAIEPDAWDVPLHAIVTEREWLTR